MHSQKLYQVALSLLPGIGDVLTKQLISYCGSAEAVFRSPKGKLRKIPGIGEKVASLIPENKGILTVAKKELEKGANDGVKLLFYTDKDYPHRLKKIYDAPALLYYKGQSSLNAPKTVAIVGTRQATAYGKEAVENIIEGLKPHCPVIISGLAYGIDITAHREALKNNLPTIGVMASGLDIIYPSVHKGTARQMINNGGLVSENKFGTKPDFHQFPERNRIIAGMADAIVVVEAGDSGGALITAEISHRYKKPLFAVPGPITSRFSRGCNALIQSGKAKMITKAQDIEKALHWDRDPLPLFSKANPAQGDFVPEENLVMEILLQNKNEMLIDELSWKTQVPMGKLASLLLTLEFKGYVKSLPGKKFKVN